MLMSQVSNQVKIDPTEENLSCLQFFTRFKSNLYMRFDPTRQTSRISGSTKNNFDNSNNKIRLNQKFNSNIKYLLD